MKYVTLFALWVIVVACVIWLGYLASHAREVTCVGTVPAVAYGQDLTAKRPVVKDEFVSE